MTTRAHLRNIAIATLLLGSPSLTLAATFQGPSQQPPSGNAPGVIWNTKGTALTQDAEINIGGLATPNSNLFLTNGKAFHVDQNGATTYQMGNWGGTPVPQKPFTFYINGDIQVSDFSPYTSQGTRGRVQASEFCFNPGGVGDCISDWGSAGGSGFVLKTGDNMTGPLQISKNFSGSVGSTSTVNISSVGLLGTTFSEMNAINAAIAPPNSANPASTMNGVKSVINQSGGSTTLAQSSAVLGNNANTGSVNDYAYGGNFTASVNNNGRINQEVSGLHGQFNATTDFNTVNRALGVYGEALNLTPTKSPNYLYGIQGYAQGKSLIETAGVFGVDFVNNARTTPQMGVSGITNLFTGGTATNAYGVRGQVTGGGGSATNAYGLHGSVVGVTATNRYGVYGDGGAGTGVYGNGTVNGVQGNGTSYGGFFTGSTYGVSGSATYAGATFTGTTYGMLVNGTGVGIDVNVPNGAGAQRGMHIHMPNKGDGIQIDGAGRGMVINAVGASATGIQMQSDDTGLEIQTSGIGVNNYAGRFQAPNVVGIAGYKDRAGIYGYSTVAGDAGGEFYNGNSNKTIYVGNGSYPIEVVTGSTSGNSQLFFVNNNGEVHANGGIYPGFYFHDRATPATKFFAWYADSVAGVSTARLFSNAIGDTLKINQANGQIFNYANTASFNIASDERLKDIRGEYTKGLEVLSQINPIIFNYKKNNPQKIESKLTHQGVSAQELLKVLPEAVQMGEDGYLTVNNDPIIWASVNSIKQLKSENDELKAKVQSLEERLNKLEEKLK